VRIRGDLLTRVLSEHVPDRATFDVIYRKQIHNRQAFWTPYPFPSIAIDDPAYIAPTNRNSWGGASQALTALRAPRWMEHYGKYADLSTLMAQWVRAITQNGAFLQQMDPVSGVFSADRGGYSPAALVLLDFVWRLHGVQRRGDSLEWNCRMPEGATHCSSSLPLQTGVAKLEHTPDSSLLSLDGKRIAEARGTLRIVTDLRGRPLSFAGTAPAGHSATVALAGKTPRTFDLAPDAIVTL
jgi:hypothetical protein